jgi:hypothetical protein
MKIGYEYFKDEAARTKRKDALAEYIKAKDKIAKAHPHLSIIQDKDQVFVATAVGLFRIGAGNSKVHFPTINFESGLTCSSQDSCPFAYKNKRANKHKKGIPLCYAQKLEGCYTNMFLAKTYQALVCERIITRYGHYPIQEIAAAIATATLGFNSKYVRLSEVGDIGPKVAILGRIVIQELVKKGMKPYLYTKRPEVERDLLRQAGAVVVISEEDFVCVPSAEAAKTRGLPVCPGECGGPEHKCFRCPLGKKTAVIAH